MRGADPARPPTRRWTAALAATAAAALAALAGIAGGVPGASSLPLSAGFTVKAFHDVDLEDAKRSLRIWAESVVKARVPDAQVELLVFNTLAEVVTAVKAKKVDMVGSSASEFMQIRAAVSLEPAMVAEVGGSVYMDAVLLARQDIVPAGISGLKGLRLQVVRDAWGTDHSIWLETQLLRLGHRTTQEFFSSTRQAQTSSQAILAVFFGNADVCLVSKVAFRLASELNPQVGTRLGIVASSSKLVGAVVSFRSDVDHAQRDNVIDIMMHAHETPAGRQLFTLFRMGRLVLYRPEYLDGIEALLREHASLTRRPGRSRR